ncbi:MAG: hypothetical protein HFG45_09530 [Oscillospiraceae bacterium]|nr:hypothetical protein [Oscillospiraceae bacterium]
MASFRYNTQTACFCGEGYVKEQSSTVSPLRGESGNHYFQICPRLP